MNGQQSTAPLACSLAILIGGAWTSYTAADGPAADASRPVTATIDADKTYDAISPHLYGMFVEHIRNIINTGMWAEMLDDRKFYHPITAQDAAATMPAPPAAGGPRGRNDPPAAGCPSAPRRPLRWTPSTRSLATTLPPSR